MPRKKKIMDSVVFNNGGLGWGAKSGLVKPVR